MTALRHLPDIHCVHCNTLFRPRREEQRYCSKDCWYAKTRTPEKSCMTCATSFKAKYAQQVYCSVDCKNKGISKDKTCACAMCGNSFERPHGKTRAYCSRACSGEARKRGMKKPEITLDARVIGDKVRSTSGYLLVRKDGKRDDNRPENLELWTGVGSSKKDPHGVRVVDKVLDMIDSLTEDERASVLWKLTNNKPA